MLPLADWKIPAMRQPTPSVPRPRLIFASVGMGASLILDTA